MLDRCQAARGLIVLSLRFEGVGLLMACIIDWLEIGELVAGILAPKNRYLLNTIIQYVSTI